MPHTINRVPHTIWGKSTEISGQNHGTFPKLARTAPKQVVSRILQGPKIVHFKVFHHLGKLRKRPNCTFRRTSCHSKLPYSASFGHPWFGAICTFPRTKLGGWKPSPLWETQPLTVGVCGGISSPRRATQMARGSPPTTDKRQQLRRVHGRGCGGRCRDR